MGGPHNADYGLIMVSGDMLGSHRFEKLPFRNFLQSKTVPQQGPRKDHRPFNEGGFMEFHVFHRPKQVFFLGGVNLSIRRGDQFWGGQLDDEEVQVIPFF